MKRKLGPQDVAQSVETTPNKMEVISLNLPPYVVDVTLAFVMRGKIDPDCCVVDECVSLLSGQRG